MWVWKATLKPTLKQREVLHSHSPRHLWISFLLARPSNVINRVLPTTGIAATHMPESIRCSLAVSSSSSTGNEIGSETSASQWPNYALVILRCIISDAGTLPPVHTAVALTRQHSIPGATVSTDQLTTRPGRTSGQE